MSSLVGWVHTQIDPWWLRGFSYPRGKIPATCGGSIFMKLFNNILFIPKIIKPIDGLTWTNHYLNQCWNINNLTLRNTIQWNINLNSYISVEENAFKKVMCEIAVTLSRPQSVRLTNGQFGHGLILLIKPIFYEIQFCKIKIFKCIFCKKKIIRVTFKW